MPGAKTGRSSPGKARVGRYLPAASWLRSYRMAWLSADLVAGITIWGMLVPEGIAYAGLAGAPAQAGLYTLLVSLAAYALLGTSRHLICAATSSTSIMAAAVLTPLVAGDPGRYGSLLAALVLAVGAIFLLAGLLRLGFVAAFISEPVMTGFVFGLAVYIAVHQLPKLIGVPRGEGNTWQQLWHVAASIGEVNGIAVALGAAGLVILVVMSKYIRRVPAALVAMVLGIAAVSILGLAESHGVTVVGDVPAGLPSLASPDVSGRDVVSLLPGAFGIALVGLSEALGAGRTLADRHDYEIDVNQELISYGAANLSSGPLGGLVACSSMSSSEVNDQAGARSELSSMVAVTMVLLTVLFLTPLFKNLPEAVLAAIVIHAVVSLMRAGEMIRFYRWRPEEFWLSLIALAGVLTLGVVPGLLLAVVLSLLRLIWRASRPLLSRLGRVPDNPHAYSSIEHHPKNETIPGLMILRFDMPLFFANAGDFRDRVRAYINGTPKPRAILVDMQSADRLDISSADMLLQLAADSHKANVELMFAEVLFPVRQMMARSGLLKKVGSGRIFDTVDEGVAYFLNKHPS